MEGPGCKSGERRYACYSKNRKEVCVAGAE